MSRVLFAAVALLPLMLAAGSAVAQSHGGHAGHGAHAAPARPVQARPQQARPTPAPKPRAERTPTFGSGYKSSSRAPGSALACGSCRTRSIQASISA